MPTVRTIVPAEPRWQVRLDVRILRISRLEALAACDLTATLLFAYKARVAMTALSLLCSLTGETCSTLLISPLHHLELAYRTCIATCDQSKRASYPKRPTLIYTHP